MRMAFPSLVRTESQTRQSSGHVMSSGSRWPIARTSAIGFTTATVGRASSRNPNERRTFPSTATYQTGGTPARADWGLHCTNQFLRQLRRTFCAIPLTVGMAGDVVRIFSCTSSRTPFTTWASPERSPTSTEGYGIYSTDASKMEDGRERIS